MSKVLPFKNIAPIDHSIDSLRVLIDKDLDDLESVVIMGYTKQGDEFFATTFADGGNVLWLVERLKSHLLES